MTAVGTRLKWADALKLFAIYLIVWGHFVLGREGVTNSDHFVWFLIDRISLPAFMSMVGFFGCAKLADDKFGHTVARKFRQLLLPAISFGFINWLLCCLLHMPSPGGFFYYTISFFWFLRSAFACTILYCAVAKGGRYSKWLLVLTLLLSQIPLRESYFGFSVVYIHGYLDNLWKMYPCFVLGVFVYKYFESFKKYAGTIFVLSAVLFAVMYLFDSGDVFNPALFLERHAESPLWIKACGFFLIRAYISLFCVVGSLTSLSLFEWLSHRVPCSRLGDTLCRWGKYTLGIYVIHMVLDGVLFSFVKMPSMSWSVFAYVFSPLAAVIETLVCIALIKLINRSRWGSFLLLGMPLRQHDELAAK